MAEMEAANGHLLRRRSLMEQGAWGGLWLRFWQPPRDGHCQRSH